MRDRMEMRGRGRKKNSRERGRGGRIVRGKDDGQTDCGGAGRAWRASGGGVCWRRSQAWACMSSVDSARQRTLQQQRDESWIAAWLLLLGDWRQPAGTWDPPTTTKTTALSGNACTRSSTRNARRTSRLTTVCATSSMPRPTASSTPSTTLPAAATA